MNELNADWNRELQELQSAGLYRELKQPAGLDFSSNDYLGHSRHPQVVAAAERALHQFGVGAPAARMLRGHTEVHAEAERIAARWQRTEAALLMPSGYQANLALLSTLPQSGDVIFSDELNHASLIDGCRMSRAAVQIFAHNDVDDLRRLLTQNAAEKGSSLKTSDAKPARKWITTERVFSMDGDQAPVDQILQLCEEFDAYLLLDEAHSAALLPVLPTHPRLVSRMITGGKALGVGGALICGSQALIHTLINRARNFIFTTSNTPAAAAALSESIRLVMKQPERVERIHQNAQLLRSALKGACLDVRGEGPIVPVVFGNPERTLLIAEQLQEQGFDVRGIRPPTVPRDSCRLRIVVHSDHTPEQIRSLATSLIHIAQASKPLVVCGTDTDVGKTVLSALMMLQMERAGHNAIYLKPVQTGSDSDTASVQRLAGLADEQIEQPVVELDLPASIDQAAEFQNCTVSAEEVVGGVRAKLAAMQSKECIVELAGGLLVPLNAKQSQADVLQSLGYPVVIAARAALGTLNHTLLTVEALRHRNIEIRGVMVIGGKHPGNLKSLRGILTDLPVIEVPHFDHLDVRHLRKWIAEGHLDVVIPAAKKLDCESCEPVQATT